MAGWLDERALEPQRFALMHAGASAKRPAKIWPHFAALAERLSAQGLAVVWLGGAEDRQGNAALAAQTGIDATGAFRLAEIVAFGRHARFAITNDSGPMHLLSASGIPVFGLFGPSDWRRNHALGQGERAITAERLSAISVDDVWSRLAAEHLV